MGYGPRVLNPIGNFAEGDKEFMQYVYNDTSNSLTAGMPVYVDVTDAAEFGGGPASNTTTALSPAVNPSGGKVVLSTNSNQSNLYCVGIYQPINITDKPAKGDVIRVLRVGRGLVSAAAKASGTAVLVGDLLITDSSQTSLLSGHNTYTAGAVVAQALATASAVAKGNSIIAVPGSSVTTQLVNAFVKVG